MVILNKVLRELVSLLVCMLTVSVAPTYVLLLCSASQCNKRHHNYEQAFIANQQSESGKRSSSTTEENASEASQVKVDQGNGALQQAKNQKITSQQRVVLLENGETDSETSSLTYEAEEPNSIIAEDCSNSKRTKFDPTTEETGSTTSKEDTLNSERIERDRDDKQRIERSEEECKWLRRLLYPKKAENTLLTEETEETGSTTSEEDTLNSERIERDRDDKQRIERSEEECNRLRQLLCAQEKDNIDVLSLRESISARLNDPNCVKVDEENKDLSETIDAHEGSCKESVMRLLPLLSKHKQSTEK